MFVNGHELTPNEIEDLINPITPCCNKRLMDCRCDKQYDYKIEENHKSTPTV